MIAFGELGNLTALMLAPATLVSPLGQITWISMIQQLYFEERNFQDFANSGHNRESVFLRKISNRLFAK